MKELARLENQHQLLIDDFGITPLDAKSRASLLEIIEERHSKSSTIIASQIPLTKRHDIIGESSFADVILDRLVHDSHRIELKGESLRKRRDPERKESLNQKTQQPNLAMNFKQTS